jgi:hypothetical protein
MEVFCCSAIRGQTVRNYSERDYRSDHTASCSAGRHKAKGRCQDGAKQHPFRVAKLKLALQLLPIRESKAGASSFPAVLTDTTVTFGYY